MTGFGNPTTTGQTGFTFGAPATGAPAPAQGLTFGTPGASTFGAAAPQPAQPTLSFGAPAAAQPAQSTLTFGAPATTQPQTGFAFGTSTSAPGAAQPTLSLTPATPGFGATPTLGVTPQPGLTFGKPATTTAAAASTGFTFGNAAAGLKPAGTAPAGGLTFGTPATSQPAAATPAPLSFGSTAPATTTTAATLSFNLPSTTTAATTTQRSVTFNLNPTTTTAQSTGFSFGTSTTASSAGLGGTAKLSFGLPTTTSATSGFAVKPSTTTATSGGNLGGEGGPPASVKVSKDNKVEPELVQLIETFKSFVKDQKNYSSEVARASLKPVSKTAEDIEALKHLVMKLERTVNQNRNMNIKLKSDTIRGLSDCEIAQRTMSVPMGFQSDNLAPLEYFAQLADRFQEHVISLRVEIENTEKHLMCALNPAALSPQELTLSIQRLHECFVALAGRLQLAHSGVASLRQRYLDVRRKKTNDGTDIFDKSMSLDRQGKDKFFTLPSPGPTPFSGSKNYHSITALANQAKQIDNFNPMLNSLVRASMITGSPSVTSPDLATQTSPSLSLKLPPGSKRGKR